jgi:hypothetical protein
MMQEAVFSKIGVVPEDIVHEIRGVKDRERLRGLLKEAVVCSDLNGFRRHFKRRTRKRGMKGFERNLFSFDRSVLAHGL